MATIHAKTMAQVAKTKHPRPGILPLAKPENKTTTADNVIIASKVPATFDLKLIKTWPRTKYDHDVVMPHDGQRIPQSIRIVHGGRPSC
jgi:hypothetical protein